MENHVYALTTCVCGSGDGSTFQIREGEVWVADDPIVKANPSLFCDTPPAPNYPRRSVAKVEQATAAPGERRGSRRG